MLILSDEWLGFIYDYVLIGREEEAEILFQGNERVGTAWWMMDTGWLHLYDFSALTGDISF